MPPALVIYERVHELVDCAVQCIDAEEDPTGTGNVALINDFKMLFNGFFKCFPGVVQVDIFPPSEH